MKIIVSVLPWALSFFLIWMFWSKPVISQESDGGGIILVEQCSPVHSNEVWYEGWEDKEGDIGCLQRGVGHTFPVPEPDMFITVLLLMRVFKWI